MVNRIITVLPMIALLCLSKLSAELFLIAYFSCSALTLGVVLSAKERMKDMNAGWDDLFWALMWPACWTLAAGLNLYDGFDDET